MRVLRPGITVCREIPWKPDFFKLRVFPAKGTSGNGSHGTLEQAHKSKVGQTNFSKPVFINPAGTEGNNPIYTAKPCSISRDYNSSQNLNNLFPVSYLLTILRPDAVEFYCGILS